MKMFRLWAFMGMMAQVRPGGPWPRVALGEPRRGCCHPPQPSLLLSPLSKLLLVSLSPDPLFLVCEPLSLGQLRERGGMDILDHWPAYRHPHVRPRLLRAELRRKPVTLMAGRGSPSPLSCLFLLRISRGGGLAVASLPPPAFLPPPGEGPDPLKAPGHDTDSAQEELPRGCYLVSDSVCVCV